MHIIIINKNQQENVSAFVNLFNNADTLFVFDRCEPVNTCNYKVNTEGTGFLAGKMRDLGAEGIDDDILFLDGDKIPQGDIIADIERLKNKYDCICYGVNKEFESSRYRAFMQVDDIDDIVSWQKDKFPYAYGCYSCGIWLSKQAITAVRKLNNGRIFHSDFDGSWGDEDNFLADELNALGFKIGFSTHVRLSGKFSDWTVKADELIQNFTKRVILRKTILGLDV